MKNDYFEVSISLHYEDLTWIAKPFKYYFDPLNTYSVSVELEQFPTQIIERIKIELKNEMMNGREIYKFLYEIKKKLVQSNVEGIIYTLKRYLLTDPYINLVFKKLSRIYVEHVGEYPANKLI